MGRVSEWLQIGANIGILVGLVFVGLQMRQDHQISAAERRAQISDNILEWGGAMIGENAADSMTVALTNPEALTHKDVVILTYFTAGSLHHLRRLAELEALGLLGSEWKDALPAIGAELGGNPATRAALLSIPSSEEWLVQLQSLARDADPHSQGKRFDAILEQARQ